MWYLITSPVSVSPDFFHNNKCVLLKLWELVDIMKTHFCRLFQKRRVNKRMFSYSLPFPKVSAKNIYDCGQKPGGSDIAHMINN